MSTTGLLLASAIVSLQPAPSADRGYAGPEAISPEEAAASGGVSSSGAAKSPAPAEGGTVEAEDLSLEDVFGPGPDADATAEAGAEGASEGPSESVESIDDVFGDGGGAAPAPEVSAAASSGGGESKGLLGGKLVLKARILSSVYYDIARTDKPGTIGRNENRLEFRLTYTPNKHIQIVGDIEPVFMGVSQARELDDLASMSMMNRFHVESRAAFVAVNDIVKGLDVKVGRQIVVWGTADKFSPTNNINPDDLEDRPLFTEPIANQMVVVDYAPLRDRLWFQGIYIPLFFPALLPPSAAAGLKDPYAEVPFASGADKAKIADFVTAYRDHGHGPLIMSLPASSTNPQMAVAAVAEARAIAYENGVQYDEIAGGNHGARSGRAEPMILAFQTYDAIAPDCPSMATVDFSNVSSNNELPTLGCAVRANQAAMIADPADLLGTRPLDQGDAVRRGVIMQKFRQGESTGSSRSQEESGTISDAVKE